MILIGILLDIFAWTGFQATDMEISLDKIQGGLLSFSNLLKKHHDELPFTDHVIDWKDRISIA